MADCGNVQDMIICLDGVSSCCGRDAVGCCVWGSVVTKGNPLSRALFTPHQSALNFVQNPKITERVRGCISGTACVNINKPWTSLQRITTVVCSVNLELLYCIFMHRQKLIVTLLKMAQKLGVSGHVLKSLKSSSDLKYRMDNCFHGNY